MFNRQDEASLIGLLQHTKNSIPPQSSNGQIFLIIDVDNGKMKRHKLSSETMKTMFIIAAAILSSHLKIRHLRRNDLTLCYFSRRGFVFKQARVFFEVETFLFKNSGEKRTVYERSYILGM